MGLPGPGEVVRVDCRPPRGREAEGGERPVLLMDWNIERGYKLDGIVEELERVDPDVLCLQEIDVGCRRSQRRDCGMEIARALGMNYVFFTEFVELDSPRRSAHDAGGGVHGNAILTKFDVLDVAVLRHSHASVPWGSPSPPPGSAPSREPRLGSRAVLRVITSSPLGPIAVYCAHLEVFCGALDRLWDLSDVLRDARRLRASGLCHALVAGDMNTMAHGIARLGREFCRDWLRWLSLGWQEGELWEKVLEWQPEEELEGPEGRRRAAQGAKRGAERGAKAQDGGKAVRETQAPKGGGEASCGADRKSSGEADQGGVQNCSLPPANAQNGAHSSDDVPEGSCSPRDASSRSARRLAPLSPPLHPTWGWAIPKGSWTGLPCPAERRAGTSAAPGEPPATSLGAAESARSIFPPVLAPRTDTEDAASSGCDPGKASQVAAPPGALVASSAPAAPVGLAPPLPPSRSWFGSSVVSAAFPLSALRSLHRSLSDSVSAALSLATLRSLPTRVTALLSAVAQGRLPLPLVAGVPCAAMPQIQEADEDRRGGHRMGAEGEAAAEAHGMSAEGEVAAGAHGMSAEGEAAARAHGMSAEGEASAGRLGDAGTRGKGAAIGASDDGATRLASSSTCNKASPTPGKGLGEGDRDRAAPLPPPNPIALTLGTPADVARDLVNPGLTCPFPASSTVTLDNATYRLGPLHLMRGKLDWMLLSDSLEVDDRWGDESGGDDGLAMGNMDYALSDHRWLAVRVRRKAVGA